MMHSSDAQRVFRPLLPGDHIRNSKNEIFRVAEKEVYFCKCKPLRCHEHADRTTYLLESVNTRKRYEVTQQYLNEKFAANEIQETLYHRGKWN